MRRIQSHIPDELRKVSKNQALSLDLFQPNSETLQAIEDTEMGRVERTSLNGLRAMIRKDKADLQ
ncbi:damage-inducible protein [Bartonella sp. WD16.2]|uniref:damage-inducible protein n=1 Tax=Bartonella sp. WD16.2 TaxID=1933904 RepID=UPI00099AF74B|nr:damage-inducible protein [Bartonella sp. WD16.2]AQX20265.1 DNA-damage-inducible protein J [Bartonella sp. WD16.2]